jgi:pyridoxamine 5'-phosphate oxidase family protein
MNHFTKEEIAYLQSLHLGRMATTSTKGDLHVVPVSYRYNPETDTIDIGGHNFASSKKYRDAIRHGRMAIVVDDVLQPLQVRFLEVRGTVQALSTGGKTINDQFDHEILRLTPTYIVSFSINDKGIMPGGDAKPVYHGRRVE